MPDIAARREHEKERRRTEILDAAERLYAKLGWEAVTVDEVARSARLSRALVYVYFRDKENLLFAIGERAMRLLRDRLIATTATPASGMQKVEAIGRAYLSYAYEFPHYFDFCTRFQSHSISFHSSANKDACQAASNQAIEIMVHAIETGVRDGSIRVDINNSFLLALTLWACTHGAVQITLAKGRDLARHGATVGEVSNYAMQFLRTATENEPAF